MFSPVRVFATGPYRDITDTRFLAETLPTLYQLPSFSTPKKLTQAKGALSFAVHSRMHNTPGVQSLDSSGSPLSGGFAGEAERVDRKSVV